MGNNGVVTRNVKERSPLGSFSVVLSRAKPSEREKKKIEKAAKKEREKRRKREKERGPRLPHCHAMRNSTHGVGSRIMDTINAQWSWKETRPWLKSKV